MPEERFWHCTPRILYSYNKAYEKRIEIMDEEAWAYGRYTYIAIATVMNNAFGSKGKPQKSYPEEPILRKALAEKEMTDEEKKKSIDAIFHRLEIMQLNFEQEKKKKIIESEGE